MTAALPPLRRRRADAAELPVQWPWLFRWFRRYARRYAARHLHAVRLSKAGGRPAPAGPVIVVLNHPSWWDPLLCYVLSETLPDRTHWGVIEQAGLKQYGFLARAGLFGVESGTARGARQFLRTASAILADPGATLWLTAQGRFADCRERPPRLRSGVGHLVRAMPGGCILPLAIELTFWDERTPEALLHFGEAIDVTAYPNHTAEEWTARVEQALERAQDQLAADALRRDPTRFDVLTRGRAGVGGAYDLWRRIKSMMTGRRFRAEHSASEENP